MQQCAETIGADPSEFRFTLAANQAAFDNAQFGNSALAGLVRASAALKASGMAPQPLVASIIE